MTPGAVDPRLAQESANAQDLVQKKLSVDALRRRLGDGRTQDQKLRDACEGFESIFIQKMWEQMRKNVKKEGYLHSKDEESYQSMFDVEFAKKMASSGGIGLADMLFDQLSQRLSKTARGTSGALRDPLSIASADETAKAEKMRAQLGDVYAPLPETVAEEEALSAVEDPAVAKALVEMRNDLEKQGADQKKAPPIAAAAEEPRRQFTIRPMPSRVSAPGKARPSRIASPAAANRPSRSPAANAAPRRVPSPEAAPSGVYGSVGEPDAPQGTGQPAVQANPVQWPVPGSISSGYGWHDTESGRVWHQGVDIPAIEGEAVKAVLAGTVLFSGEKEGFGKLVILEHEGGYRSFYGNAAGVDIVEGSRVDIGREIAQIAMPAVMGAGNPSPHLHFEMRRGELAVNPETAIAAVLTDTNTTAA